MRAKAVLASAAVGAALSLLLLLLRLPGSRGKEQEVIKIPNGFTGSPQELSECPERKGRANSYFFCFQFAPKIRKKGNMAERVS